MTPPPPSDSLTSAPQAVLDAARATLATTPDDARALRDAAEASAALDLPESVDWAERWTAAQPDDGDAWKILAEALVSEGEDERATRALQRCVELAPDDTEALVDLALLQHRAGQAAAAADLLDRALATAPDSPALLRTLVDLHLVMGRPESALRRAEELARVDPENVLAHLDIAEIALSTGDHVKASRAFERLRRADDTDGHQVFAYHGMIEADVLADRWRLALNAALDATAVDRHELTTDLLLFVAANVFGEAGGDREPRPWDELAAKLAIERAEHRRFHTEQALL